MSRLCIAVAAIAILLALGPSRVLAHARFDHSTPSPGQVLATSPPAVDIYTVQDLRKTADADVITVVDAAQNRVDTGNTVVDDSNRRHFSVGLQPNLPPGRYLVAFKTLSDQDGEADSGQFAFYVGAPPKADQQATDAKLAVTSKAPDADSEAPASHTGLAIAIAVVAALVVAGVIGGFTWTRRRKSSA
jgi:methionine-rich copper-binding protein CopC